MPLSGHTTASAVSGLEHGPALRRDLFEKLCSSASNPDCSTTVEMDVAPEATDDSEDCSLKDSDGVPSNAHLPEHSKTTKSAGKAQPATTSNADAVVEWPIIMAIARHQTGMLGPHTLEALLSGVPRSSTLPSVLQLPEFQDALSIIYSGIPQKTLANKIGPLIAGSIDLDPASTLHPSFKTHVKKQPLHGRVPLLTASAVHALFSRADISEVIGVDCRTAEEYEVRAFLTSILVHVCPMLIWAPRSPTALWAV
jgi:hypothetical protein